MSHPFALSRTHSAAFRPHAGLALACFCLALSATTRAQSSSPGVASESPSRLLTPKEGRAIVNVAWQQDLPTHGARDCSHFVHEIFQNAGFAYPYASSFEIYAGHESFARVKYPRAGDLIVWPGHVGIVVDPAEHSFYSLVRTGLQEQDYQSAYWRSRGRPRFFRFRVENEATISAANTPPPGRVPGSAPRSDLTKSTRARIASAPNENVDLAPDDRLPAANRSTDRPPTASSERRTAIYGPPAPADLRDSPARDRDTDTDADSEVDATSPLEPPKSAIITTTAKVPTRDEVAEAISELSDALGGVLRQDDPFNAQAPVVIVEQFDVEKIDIKRDHGWAHLTIDSKVSIGSGALQLKRRREKVRWELQRTQSGWEAVTPTDRTYVPHDVAVKNLAVQLAHIAASDGAAQHDPAILRREAQIAGVLSALLEKK